MRLFDFMVYYPMSNFKRKEVKEFTWGGPLDRATLLAAITTSFFAFAVLETICSLIFNVNILDVWYTIFLLLVGCIVMALLFNYIYKTKKRYEYIISSLYNPFTLNVTLGVTICFFLFLFSLIISVGAGLLINILLKK
jgi:hypothetical protein